MKHMNQLFGRTYREDNPGNDGGGGTPEEQAAAKIVADKVVADKVIADKVIADKVVADKVIADKVIADKAAADQVIADKAAADQVIADKAAADKLAAAPAAEKALLTEVMAKKATIKTQGEKISAQDTKIAALEKAAEAWKDVDITAVNKLLADQKTEAEKKLIAAREFDQVKDQMNVAHKVVVDGHLTTIKELTNKLTGKDTDIDNLSIGNSFAASEFVNKELNLPATKARQLFGNHFERDEAGNVVGFNKPAGASDRAPLVNGEGVNLNFDEAFRKIVDADPDKKSLYKSKIKPGSGSHTDPLGDNDDDPPKTEPGTNRIALGLKDGQLKEGKGLNLGAE